MLRLLSRLLALALLLAGAAAPAAAETPMKIVASFTILADMAKAVGGDRVQVTAIIGPDAEAHGYEPTPKDSRAAAEAQLLVVNGLGLDDWLVKLARAAKSKAPVLVLSEGVTPLRAGAGAGQDHRHEHDRKRDAVDPHAWHDPAVARHYVKALTTALSQIDPAGAEGYAQRAAQYRQEIDAMEAFVRESLAAVPADRRKVIASHDAFAYFSRAFGVRFLSAQGINGGEVSAGGLAALIRQVRKEGARVVFVESSADPRLAQRLAAETGAIFGGKLYADALSAANGPAATYLGLMRWNAKTLLDGMNRAAAP